MPPAAGTTGPTRANLFEGVESTESHMSKHETGVWQAASFRKLKSSDVNEMASFPKRLARNDVIMQYFQTGYK